MSFSLTTEQRSARRQRRRSARNRLARQYLRGEGLEIGALADPLRLAPGVKVRYVDQETTVDLRRRYPRTASRRLVRLDYLADAHHLTGIPRAAHDFVAACAVLEYLGDPIGALVTWRAVVRPGGVVLVTVADYRRTLDRLRPPTPLGRLFANHAHGPLPEPTRGRWHRWDYSVVA